MPNTEYMDCIMKDLIEIEHRLNNLNREDGLVFKQVMDTSHSFSTGMGKTSVQLVIS
jgi:hypothetical protein